MSQPIATRAIRPLQAKRLLAAFHIGRPQKRTTMMRPNRFIASIVCIAVTSMVFFAFVSGGSPALRTGLPEPIAAADKTQSFTAGKSSQPTIKFDDWGTIGTNGGSTHENAYFAQFSAADAKDRKSNAALIVALGKQRGLSDRTIAIAVATSIQETGLRNLSWGDRDSLGLYQQRPSVLAWGTAQQILNRTHAIGQFYDRLERIPNRDKRPMIDVAIQIQVPNPRYYHRDWKWDAIATQIVKDYSAAKTAK